jgi:hypothetical protein
VKEEEEAAKLAIAIAIAIAVAVAIASAQETHRPNLLVNEEEDRITKEHYKRTELGKLHKQNARLPIFTPSHFCSSIDRRGLDSIRNSPAIVNRMRLENRSLVGKQQQQQDDSESMNVRRDVYRSSSRVKDRIDLRAMIRM